MSKTHKKTIELMPKTSERLQLLCGHMDHNIRAIETYFNITVDHQNHRFSLMGDTPDILEKACYGLKKMYQKTVNKQPLTDREIHLILAEQPTQKQTASVLIKNKKKTFSARGENQQQYVKNLMRHTVNFGIGPSGTGKTFLAIACAVHALEQGEVERIILTRPIVEAGEKLGFLPGSLEEKTNPYLRPLYDALEACIESHYLQRLIQRHVIEIAPLAYMRGRTLNNAFIILDEGQNTTPEQIKMFITRLGFGSKVAITGDITQVDLPQHQSSGLAHILQVTAAIHDIKVTHFVAKDIIRHPLVQAIILAYEQHEQTHRK